MSDKIDITLQVMPDGRRYPVRIDPEEEALVRKAAEQLRQKFIVYRQHFQNTDNSDLDILAMVAIHLVYDKLKLEQEKDMEPFISRIGMLDRELQQILKI